jgi:hypothetical protein
LSVFIGLVTHEKSRYYLKGVINNEFCELITSLNNVDQFLVCSRNFHLLEDENNFSIRELYRNIYFYIKSLVLRQIYILKIVGIRYIFHAVYNTFQVLYNSIQIILKFLYQTLTKSGNFSNNRIRIKNIEASHKNLLNEFLASDSEYLIIVEDDFKNLYKKDTQEIFSKILGIVEREESIKILNLSRSFSIDELKIRYLVKYKFTKIGFGQELLILHYPVLNTVCATLYKKNAVKSILEELSYLETFSLIPIDEKINIILYQLIRKNILSLQCYASINPGIFSQGSIHEE